MKRYAVLNSICRTLTDVIKLHLLLIGYFCSKDNMNFMFMYSLHNVT